MEACFGLVVPVVEAVAQYEADPPPGCGAGRAPGDAIVFDES